MAIEQQAEVVAVGDLDDGFARDRAVLGVLRRAVVVAGLQYRG